MRIWYAGNFEWPAPLARSIQTVHTAHALSRAGASCRLVTMKPPRPYVSIREALDLYGLSPHPRFSHRSVPVLRALDRFEQIEIHKRLAITNFSYCALAAIQALLAASRRGSRPDWIVARDPRVAWTFLKLRHLTGIPVVYEVHELFGTRPRDNASLDANEQWGVADRTRNLESTVLQKADRLITLTQACRSLIIASHGISPERVQAIPDGSVVPEETFDVARPGGGGVFYVGQLYPWKGVDTLIRAFVDVPDASLTIIGAGIQEHGVDRDRARLELLAESLGISQRVYFESFRPYRDVPAALRLADVAVVPLPDVLMSRYFTSPLKLFDYMVAGVPIVASDLPSIREVIQSDINGLLVRPDNSADLASGLRRLLMDPTFARRLATQARADVSAYSWDARAQRILRFLSLDNASGSAVA